MKFDFDFRPSRFWVKPTSTPIGIVLGPWHLVVACSRCPLAILSTSRFTCQFRSFLRQWPTAGHDDVIRQPDMDWVSRDSSRTISWLHRQVWRYETPFCCFLYFFLARIVRSVLKAVASPAVGTGARVPSIFNSFVFSSLWSKSDSQISKYCVVGEISWCRCQQLTTLSISTAFVTELLTIDQLLQPALKFAVSAPWPNFQLSPSPQQILATPLLKGMALRHCARVLALPHFQGSHVRGTKVTLDYYFRFLHVSK